MASQLSVHVDVTLPPSVGELLKIAVFPRLAAAVEQVAQVGVERWQAAALSAPLWEGERRAYAESIRYSMTGAFTAEIVSDYKYVEDIERGRPPYDLKKMLDTSLKVRLSKKGLRYLIIPFRHNTPGNTGLARAMPRHVYAQAKQLEASKVVGHGQRLSGTGAWDPKTKAPTQVRSRTYVWGGRLAAAHGPRLPGSGKRDRHDGMVRFQTTTPGGKASSSYLTFRVMVEGSPGWIIPARPGLWIARAVADSLQRTGEQAFAAAVSSDLAA